MHKIVANILKNFSESFGFIEGNTEAKQLEYLVNYLITSGEVEERVNPVDITTQDDDAAIDGISIIVDGKLIISKDEIESLMESTRGKFHVKIILTQVKSSESFSKSEITNFLSGILVFLDENSTYPQGEFNLSRKEILFYLLENVNRIQNNMPDLEVFYCTTGRYNEEPEIQGVFDVIVNTITKYDFFNSVKAQAIDRQKIIALNKQMDEDQVAKVLVTEYFPIPDSENIPKAFLSLVNAKEFVAKLISNDDGTAIKNNIFDENIRAYLGADVTVNEKIQKSLHDGSSREIFSILNNGITIIASDLSYAHSKRIVDVTNYQIINGCQTSNVLFHNKEVLDEDCSIIVKFIQTQDKETINKIIASTNSQSHIEDTAFLSLKDKTRMVQIYFDTINQDNSMNNEKIYFERRQNEYKDSIQQISRIFDLKSVVRSYNSMFLDAPHTSSRYVKELFEKNNLFKEDDSEAYYYVSTLCLYKIQSLINSKKFKHGSTLKWHFLYLFKYIVLKKKNGYESNSNKASVNADKLIAVLNNRKKFDEVVQQFNDIVDMLEIPTRDVLKRQKYSVDLKAKAFEKLGLNK